MCKEGASWQVLVQAYEVHTTLAYKYVDQLIHKTCNLEHITLQNTHE